MAYEIEEIYGKVGETRVDHLVDIFPSLRKKDVMRNEGEIELLIGMEYAELHPTCIDSCAGLLLCNSDFGTG